MTANKMATTGMMRAPLFKDDATRARTVEDGIKKFFNSQAGFTEEFTLVDRTLALCIVICLVSLLVLLYDYFIAPMPDSWVVLLVCSVSFALMGILTLFSTFVEKNYFYIAKERREGGIGTPNEWRVDSSLVKYSDQFTLRVSYTEGGTKTPIVTKTRRSIGDWFNERGILLEDWLFEDLQEMQDYCKHKKRQ